MSSEQLCPTGGVKQEQVLESNPRERLKAKRACPLDIIHSIDEVVSAGYEAVSEEELVLLKWWGVIHEKPKVGYFSVRVAVPAGVITPSQLRLLGELSRKFGDGTAKITNRQGMHLFRVKLRDIKEVMESILFSGLRLAGGCGDAPRNITSCPLSGVGKGEPFDPCETISLLVKEFHGNRRYANLPHKFKIAVGACPYHCYVPYANDVGLIGVQIDGEPGFTPVIGGGMAVPPRIAKHLPVFVRQGEEAVGLVRAILSVWSSNPKYRLSFARARLKFLLSDCDLETIKLAVELFMGKKLRGFSQIPRPFRRDYHMGVGELKEPGLYYVGFPILAGILRSEQLFKIAEIAEESGSEIRFTVQQNLLLVKVSEEEVRRVVRKMFEIGLSVNVSSIRKHSTACTADPYCVYSLGLGLSPHEVLDELASHLERSVGDVNLTIGVSGCPHGCARHALSDIGIQETSIITPSGGKVQGFDIYVGGGQEGEPAIATKILSRVNLEEAKRAVERIARTYMKNRIGEEPFKDFCSRYGIERLKASVIGGNDGER